MHFQFLNNDYRQWAREAPSPQITEIEYTISKCTRQQCLWLFISVCLLSSTQSIYDNIQWTGNIPDFHQTEHNTSQKHTTNAKTNENVESFNFLINVRKISKPHPIPIFSGMIPC